MVITPEDMFVGQSVALSRLYNGLPKGLRGTVQGYRGRDNKVLVKLNNRNKTEEYIPANYLFYVLWSE